MILINKPHKVMTKKQITFHYTVFSSIEDVEGEDKKLLLAARAATETAYAPYSHFFVAAAALLSDGSIVCATNQENASYPVGICAERTLLAALSATKHGESITAMAISYRNSKKEVNDVPVSPCGMCRQALIEWEQRQQKKFKILLSGQTGEVFIIDQATDLLPLLFANDFIK
jgi:cytidine deaminase